MVGEVADRRAGDLLTAAPVREQEWIEGENVVGETVGTGIRVTGGRLGIQCRDEIEIRAANGSHGYGRRVEMGSACWLLREGQRAPQSANWRQIQTGAPCTIGVKRGRTRF